MLQEYIQENKTLKSENSQLEKFREKVRKQHEILTRENEKLARKLEQLMRSQTDNPKSFNDQSPVDYIILEEPTIVKTLPKIEKQASYTVESVKFKKIDFEFCLLKCLNFKDRCQSK